METTRRRFLTFLGLAAPAATVVAALPKETEGPFFIPSGPPEFHTGPNFEPAQWPGIKAWWAADGG